MKGEKAAITSELCGGPSRLNIRSQLKRMGLDIVLAATRRRGDGVMFVDGVCVSC